MMFSSSVARRIAINANNTRHNAAATVRSKHHQKLTSSTTKRSLVSLTQQQQQSQPSVQYYGIDRTAQPLIWCPNTQFVPTKQQHTHHQQKQPKRYMSSSDLPYHLVVGMPALSPTMSSGSISKWNVKEGDTFVAGDSLALIETDKASMDFEAQDDGVVAKLLVAEGGGEIECGTPIMVTVEEEGDVASFANFVADASPAAAVESAPDVETPPSAPTPPPAAPAEDLPYHLVVGMPALSPTMDAGTISKWNVKEGESFSAGDSIAVIETDKASMDFEAQDDGVVAKLLVEAGSGEIAVGVPVMVTVEEEGDVAAFANFVAGSAPDSSKTEAEVTPEQPAVAVSTTPPVAVAPAAPVAAPTPTPAAAVAAPVTTTTTPPAPLDAISLGGSTWGKLAAEKSPLAKLLASKQKQYIEKYGSTGHIPIV